ncbi:hypothetical protein [Altererythrobacter ishigakiensis]|uniref:Invasion protein IalB n=1 Tax=Altererythrobacter ishigakiensis TaxID=476157 RepID=A0A562UXC9_9SPHN|nr:hypothetical protein [Altererythrobacter ishigakiensis]TWJ10320.1 hypothetical protein JN10_1983 [Altererythrobacter ishigakiensis]
MNRLFTPTIVFGLCVLLAAPLAAKDSLGVFSDWAAFRDIEAPRCYAIALAEPVGPQASAARDYEPYASIGSWPYRQIRNQLHIRLSREIAQGASISLRLGGRTFELSGGGGDAWAKDRAMDAAIIARMRSSDSMRVTSTTTSGRRFTDTYVLDGVATAIDAATLGCAPAALEQARRS